MANENQAGGWLYIPATDFHPRTLTLPSTVDAGRSYTFEIGVAQRIDTDEDFDAFQKVRCNIPGRPGDTEMFKTGRPDTDKPLDITDPTVLAQLKELIESGQLRTGGSSSETDIVVDIGKDKPRGVTTETVGSSGMIGGKDE
ncbi:MAG: hypothetical protein JRI72_04365 [Deltaproteobacteria bacterium]|nr:hypothetical protein [Deltaproteobacteria bacterium]